MCPSSHHSTPPPHHPPLPDDKPISPPLKSLPHHHPPKERKTKSLIMAIIFGTIIAAGVGFILWYFEISINIILPVLAPIWIGTITLVYSVNSKH